MTLGQRATVFGTASAVGSVGLAFVLAAIVRPMLPGPGAASADATAKGSSQSGNSTTGPMSSGSSNGGQMMTGADNTGSNPKDAPSNGTAQATPGKRLYAANCAGCHGAKAEGGMGPDLHPHASHSAAELAKVIQNGQGQMPAFKSKLKASDIQALIGFIHSLKQ